MPQHHAQQRIGPSTSMVPNAGHALYCRPGSAPAASDAIAACSTEIHAPVAISLDPFDDLADELLLHVLGFITDTRTLAHCSLVCRRWNRIMRDNLLWRYICSRNRFAPIFIPMHLPEAVAASSGLGSLVRAMRFSSAASAPSPNTLRRRALAQRRNHWSQSQGLGASQHHRPSSASLALVHARRRQASSSASNPTTEPTGELADSHLAKIPRSISLAPWKKVYRDNYLIWLNWMRGRCTIHRVRQDRANGNLCVQFDDSRAVSWDIATGQCRLQLSGHQGVVSAVKFNKNIVVTGGSDSAILVWDLDLATCVRTLRGHSGEVACLQHTETTIVSGSEDQTIRIQDGLCTGVLRGHTGAVCCLQFNDGLIVSGSTDTTLRVWSLPSGRCLRVLRGHTSHVFCLQFDDTYICSGGDDTTIKVWSVHSGKLLRTLHGHHLGVVCLQFDDIKLVSGSADKTIKIWNIKTGHNLYTLKQHTGSIWNLCFTKTQLISSSLDETMLIWNFAVQKRRGRKRASQRDPADASSGTRSGGAVGQPSAGYEVDSEHSLSVDGDSDLSDFGEETDNEMDALGQD
ncbi:hypothetical protein HK105_209431 [Polyrhizophydium stewartii]|uniref:F-box domain-containing protein n=1 Tax=Polyrhizophydium stewartii TaxID=2732419 RepID=A0ABR4MV13_9FUNG